MTVGPVASRCLGCAPTILDVGHDCGGDRIPSEELGWRCVCPEPECRRRQGGQWPAGRPSRRRALET